MFHYLFQKGGGGEASLWGGPKIPQCRQKVYVFVVIDEVFFPEVVVELAARRDLHHQHHLLLVLEY